MTDPRYPIGKFEKPAPLDEAGRRRAIDTIAAAPARARAAVAGLSDAQLDTPYRVNGWTVRQVVHHLPDSHMNSYVRFRLALTEEEPTIRPYHEDRWAELPDAKRAPVALSLDILDALHARWVRMLGAMTPADFARTLRHPESGLWTLDGLLALYAWHGDHHIAQITSLRDRERWGKAT